MCNLFGKYKKLLQVAGEFAIMKKMKLLLLWHESRQPEKVFYYLKEDLTYESCYVSRYRSGRCGGNRKA